MILGDVFNSKSIKLALESSDKDEVIEELVEQFVSSYPGTDRVAVLNAIQDRESKMSTGVMHGIAIPHGKVSTIKGVHGVIGISREGIDYGSLDNEPVSIFFMIISGVNEYELSLRTLRRLVQVVNKPDFIRHIYSQNSAEGIYKVLCEFENSVCGPY